MTKQIEITQNNFVLVDDDMFDVLKQYKWFVNKGGNTCYARRNEKGTKIYMHRQILNLKHGDGKIVDHINKNGLDNRRENLRIVNKMANNHNHDGYSHNTSGYTGVCWNVASKKWAAQITVNYRDTHLGYYTNIEDAVNARKQGEIKYWKDNK